MKYKSEAPSKKGLKLQEIRANQMQIERINKELDEAAKYEAKSNVNRLEHTFQSRSNSPIACTLNTTAHRQVADASLPIEELLQYRKAISGSFAKKKCRLAYFPLKTLADPDLIGRQTLHRKKRHNNPQESAHIEQTPPPTNVQFVQAANGSIIQLTPAPLQIVASPSSQISIPGPAVQSSSSNQPALFTQEYVD
ncbi:hypothetical protein E3N88_23042 [Mikania micrantha]|uniref:Uncharacterized protein n=1 Tax=Mikania micrantha TaxID=192012 RepID=A0A5N6NC64_9ASTR|nr:hypothetical protein E3N88_23042 [Mikania micrantha]